MARAGRDHVIVRLLVLQHQVHRFHVIPGEPPIAHRAQVSERKVVLEPQLQLRERDADLARDEILPPARRFMVEEDARAHEQAVLVTVGFDEMLVGKQLGFAIGAHRRERRVLVLRRRRFPEHLAGGGVIDSDLRIDVHRLVQQAAHPEIVHLHGLVGALEGDAHVGLCGKIVDLVRLRLLERGAQRGAVAQIAVDDMDPSPRMHEHFTRSLPLRNGLDRFNRTRHCKDAFDFRFVDVQCHRIEPFRVTGTLVCQPSSSLPFPSVTHFAQLSLLVSPRRSGLGTR